MAHDHEQRKKILSIWLQPNDIAKAWSVQGTFVERVEGIKKNILTIIAEKSLEELNIFGLEPGKNKYVTSARQLVGTITSNIGLGNVDRATAELVSNFTKAPKIVVHIDDIDRGWAATSRDVENISALINAARDIMNTDETLTFRIGIRTDAYNLVRAHDESGDKFEPYVVQITWTNHEILVMMAKRIAGYFDVILDETKLQKQGQLQISRNFYPIIEDKFQGAGHWSNRAIHNVLLSLTRRRPRDLVKLLAGAAAQAENSNNTRISTKNLTDSFPEYSKGRIADLVSEFGSELPKIEDVAYSMKPTTKEYKNKEKRFIYSNDEAIKKLNGIASNQSIFFKSGIKATGITLLSFLYKIDFLIARKDENNTIERLYYQDHPNIISPSADFGYSWEVHPAYRWALNPKSVDDILADIAS